MASRRIHAEIDRADATEERVLSARWGWRRDDPDEREAFSRAAAAASRCVSK